jgi:hypothetical protein
MYVVLLALTRPKEIFTILAKGFLHFNFKEKDIVSVSDSSVEDGSDVSANTTFGRENGRGWF